jgi:hypothetical protein
LSAGANWSNLVPLGAAVLGGLCIFVVVAERKANKHKVEKLLSREQQPFWLTGESIALSNLSITPPPQARWWWKEKISFVFVQHLAVRFSIDACTRQLIWEDNLLGCLTLKIAIHEEFSRI